MWFLLNTCFPYGSLEFAYVLGKGACVASPPVKALGTQFLMSFIGW